jgi:formylglycine-generating enzyme required for sulfatase activity
MASGILPSSPPVKSNRVGPIQRLTNRVAPRVTTRIQRSTDRVIVSQQQIPESNPTLEISQFPAFTNSLGASMILVPTGQFLMGSGADGASPNEGPVTKVHISRFYISRHPVTNAQFEAFDPAHRNKRLPTGADDHPVVHVSSGDAIKFCRWLSARERRKYRLPSEAEWEYAARGTESRTFPWGENGVPSPIANFADRNTNFAWSDATVDDGYAETAPVGSFSKGASPFGAEDMAGNVWEWCLDFFESYKGGERINPRGPATGVRRVYRGGSWKSRFQSLRASARSSNIPNFSCNDVGFRIICEVE